MIGRPHFEQSVENDFISPDGCCRDCTSEPATLVSEVCTNLQQLVYYVHTIEIRGRDESCMVFAVSMVDQIESAIKEILNGLKFGLHTSGLERIAVVTAFEVQVSTMVDQDLDDLLVLAIRGCHKCGSPHTPYSGSVRSMFK
jgi:Fe-S cluster biogenesis protein NfuA